MQGSDVDSPSTSAAPPKKRTKTPEKAPMVTLRSDVDSPDETPCVNTVPTTPCVNTTPATPCGDIPSEGIQKAVVESGDLEEGKSDNEEVAQKEVEEEGEDHQEVFKELSPAKKGKKTEKGTSGASKKNYSDLVDLPKSGRERKAVDKFGGVPWN